MTRRPIPRARLLAATAFAALVAPGAHGQPLNLENLAEIEQDGSDNEAVIDQAGQSNLAGTTAQPMFQDGAYNRLQIDQRGNFNQIGNTGSAVFQRSLFGSPNAFNNADLRQEGNRNRIDQVIQQTFDLVPGAGNRLILRQIDGDDNVIAMTWQEQLGGMPGQSATVLMEGFRNRIDLLEQQSRSDLRDEENSIFVLIRGSNNGTTALRGVSQLPLVVGGTLRQVTGTEDLGANANRMSLEILGNDTAFGIIQRGRGNDVGAVVITGDNTSLGIDQDGFENDLTINLIAGDDNEIGVSQYGTNRAFLSLLGDSSRNEVLIDQMGTNDALVTIEGDLNLISVSQQYQTGIGGSNDAEVFVIGDSNLADLLQEGTRNTAELVITGDANNAPTRDFAAHVAPFAVGLRPGEYRQQGSDNAFLAEIEGNNNLSAFFQQGVDNLFSLMVIGDDNEAILRQIGAGNAAELTQMGRGNTAVIMQ